MPTRRREPLSLAKLRLFTAAAGLAVLALAFSGGSFAAAPAPEPGAAKATVIKAPSAQLYVEERGRGAGTPLLVVNGGPGFDHNYLHISQAWDVLAKNRRVIFYDQRGNGRSPALANGQSCNLADQIEDLEAVRAHSGADKIDLLGHSWGGYLVMAYAARHPEHISHLIICDSAAPKWGDTRFIFNDVYPETIAKQDALQFADTLGDQAAIDAGIKQYLTMLFVSAEKRDAFMAHADDYHYNRPINQTLNTDLARFDLNPELPKYSFPTLVLTGRFDANVAPSTAWKIHQAIPGSRFAVFERSGHLPFYEEPDEFVRVVEEFLGR